jgi:hypothetical protein
MRTRYWRYPRLAGAPGIFSVTHYLCITCRCVVLRLEDSEEMHGARDRKIRDVALHDLHNVPVPSASENDLFIHAVREANSIHVCVVLLSSDIQTTICYSKRVRKRFTHTAKSEVSRSRSPVSRWYTIYCRLFTWTTPECVRYQLTLTSPSRTPPSVCVCVSSDCALVSFYSPLQHQLLCQPLPPHWLPSQGKRPWSLEGSGLS